MAAEAHIKAVITADDRASDTLGKFGGGLGNISGLGMAAAAGIAAAGAAAVAFGVSSFNAFTESERAGKMLEHAVVAVTGATKEQLNQTNLLAEAISKKGVLDDDTIKTGLAQLSTFGLSNKAVQNLGQSMADLTVNQFGVAATSEQAADAANMMAKALNGQFGILEKSGIRFTDAQKKIIEFGTEEEKVAAINAGFAQNLKYTNDVAKETAEGGMARLNVAWGNIMETVGGGIANVLTPAINGITTLMQQWQEGSNPVLEGIKAGFASLFQFVQALANFYITILKPAIEFVAAAFINYLLPSLQALADDIRTQVMPMLQQFWAQNKDWIIPVLQFLAVVIGVVVVGAIMAFIGAMRVIVFIVSQVGQAFNNWLTDTRNVIGALVGMFNSIVPSINSALSGVWNAITEPFRRAFDWVKDQANKVKDTLTGALDPNKRHSPSLVDKINIGTDDIKNQYAGLFNDMKSMGTGFKVADFVATPKPMAQSDTAINRQNSTEINISLSGIFTGTPGEARKLAEMVADNLKTIAGSHNTTVTQMLGG